MLGFSLKASRCPVLVLTTLPQILRLHIESCSIGSFRHHHRETLKYIIRLQRTETALRVMRILSNARLLAINKRKIEAKEKNNLPNDATGNDVYHDLSPEQEVALRRQLEDAERAWKCIDVDSSGTIDENEMELLMQSIGQKCGKEDIVRMMLELDLDGEFELIAKKSNAKVNDVKTELLLFPNQDFPKESEISLRNSYSS